MKEPISVAKLEFTSEPVKNNDKGSVPSVADKTPAALTPVIGYEKGYKDGYADGFAAADLSSASIVLCSIGLLSLLISCAIVLRHSSRLINVACKYVNGEMAKKISVLLLPILVCASLAACAGKNSSPNGKTVISAEESAPVSPEVKNAPAPADKSTKADAFTPHDASYNADRQTLSVDVPVYDVDGPRLNEPEELAQLLDMKGTKKRNDTAVSQLRPKAIREAAQLMGFQGGMSWRYHKLLVETERYGPILDMAFNFGPLLLTQGEALIMPPQIARGGASMRIEDTATATSAKTTFELLEPARFVSTVPLWREFLMADGFPEPEEPNPSILPQNDKERAIWRQAIREAWRHGSSEADGLYADNVFRMARTYQGLLLYHLLTAQHLLSRVQTASSDLGTRNQGNKLNIGQNVYRITAPAKFTPKSGKL